MGSISTSVRCAVDFPICGSRRHLPTLTGARTAHLAHGMPFSAPGPPSGSPAGRAAPLYSADERGLSHRGRRPAPAARDLPRGAAESVHFGGVTR